MLIPLGTDRPLHRPTLVTPLLIGLCAVGYSAQIILDPRSGPGEADFTSTIWVIGGEGFAWYRTLTSAFAHGDLLHLLGNMLFLWVFGRAVEDKLGRLGFTLFYLAGAVFSGWMHSAFEAAPAVGASGAISAVTGAFLVLFPRTRIKVLWFFILISLMHAPAWFFIGLQIAWNLLASATGGEGNIATLAHLAGYAYGFVLALVLLWARVLSREPCDLFTISKQAKRRREFRAASQIKPRPAEPENPMHKERTQAVAQARAAVSGALSAGRVEGAAEPYRTLLDRHGDEPGAATLSRNAQYQLATHLYSIGEHALAKRAFTDFLSGYPRDTEAPQIKVLLGRMLASDGQAIEARRLLSEALEALKIDGLRAIARSELDALGPLPGASDELGSTA